MSGYLREVLADAPAFYYPLTSRDVSGATALDRSGNARHGAISGALAFDLDPFTPASGFDGNTLRYVDSPYTTANTAAGTLEAWCRPAAQRSTGVAHVLSKSGYFAATTSDFPLILRARGGGVDRFDFSIDGGVDFSADQTLSSSAYTASGLYHVVAAYSNASTPYLMVNGVVVATGSAQSVGSSARAWRVGAAPFEQSGGIGENYYAGRLGHVAFYPAYLTQARALVHYSAGVRMGVSY